MNCRLKSFLSVVISLILTLSCFSISVYASGTAKIVTPPTQTKFYEGISWVKNSDSISIIGRIDPSGTVLSYNSKECHYSKGAFGENMSINPVSGNWKAGNNEVKIDCDEFPSGVFAYTNIYLASISNIKIVKSPDKINLLINKDWKMGSFGDVEITSFDLTGIQLSVKYDNSVEKIISYSDNHLIGWSVDPNVELFYPGKSTLYATFEGYLIPFNVYYLKELIGDISEDSKINSYDALLALKHSTGLIKLTSSQFSKGDIDKNGKVNSSDALMILKFVVGISETLYM